MSRTVLILLAAVSLGFAPAPFLPKKPRTAKADLKALQGEWVWASVTIGLGETEAMWAPHGDRPTYVLSSRADGSVNLTGASGQWKLTPNHTNKAGRMIRHRGGEKAEGSWQIEGDYLTIRYKGETFVLKRIPQRLRK
jgi:hypothetical protein